jgi:acetate kinase
MREIYNAAQNGNERAQLTIKMYCYRIKKYIGAYVAAMNGIEILVFTGGIGENATFIREEVCREMDFFGIELDLEKNNSTKGFESVISADNTKVKVIVVPTNEEYIIAQDTMEIIEKGEVVSIR